MAREPAAMPVTTRRAVENGPEWTAIPVGHDGAAMLAVSVLLMLASGGLTCIAAVLLVAGTALRATTASDATRGAVVVLGHRLDANASASTAFLARLDRAAALWRAAPNRRVLVLGGPSRPGQPTEAEVGRAVLIAQGLPVRCIQTEGRSRHTLENLRGLRAAVVAEDAHPVTLVTSRPHLARAALMARGMGILCEPCAAEPHIGCAGLLAIPREAFLLHWYVTGRGVAWLTGNRRLAARVT